MISPAAGVWRIWRALLRRPGHLVLGATTLALGVGTFFATFALVDALVLTPPAFSHHGSVVLYGEVVRPASPRSLSASMYQAIGLPPGVVSHGLARAVERVGVRSGEHAGLLAIQRVDPGFLPTLGVAPARGGIGLERDGADGALVSWRLWKTWFAADEHVVGRELIVEGRVLPVVGVLPATYRFFDEVDVLLPLRPAPGAAASVPNYLAVAGLAPAATTAGLVARMRAAAARDPTHGNLAALATTRIDTALRQQGAPTLWFLLACALLVLAVACGNLANLMLVRSLGRSRETAVRRALGAGAWHVWSPAASEAALIGLLGLALGCVFGRAMVLVGADYIPDAWRVNGGALAIGWRAYAASVIVAAAASGLAALGGTLHEHGDALLREHIGGGLPVGGVTAVGMRMVLVQVQMAIATILLSLCVVRGMQQWQLDEVVPGFDPAGILVARFRPDPAYVSAIPSLASAMQGMAERASQLPGAIGAGVTTQLPAGTSFNVAFAGADGHVVEAQLAVQTPGARAALGMHLIAGRDLAPTDSADAPPVMVVNQSFLASVQGAIPGGTVRKVSRSLGTRELRIIGVVADTRDAGPGLPPRPLAIVPFEQLPLAEYATYRSLLSYFVIVRGAGDSASAGMDIATAIRSATPWLVLDRPRPLSRAWQESRAEADRDAWLATLFAGVGVCLGLLGLYSVQRVDVASRRRDLAVRAALGAAPLDLFGVCFAQGISRASPGISLGLLVAAAWSRWPQASLANDIRLDPPAALVVAVAMLAMSAAVAMAPAWRSASTSPLLALRNQ